MELLILILLTTTVVLILALCNSLMSYFLDYCFYENAIFGWWLPFLASKIVHLWHRDELASLEPVKNNKDLYEKRLIQIADSNFLFKILGGCIICSNVWQCITCFTIMWGVLFYHNYVNGWSWLLLLPYIFISNFFVRKISKND